ncbi:MAG: hypothetical protein ACRDD7_09335 [Peptostreptococcaceae bacterium]
MFNKKMIFRYGGSLELDIVKEVDKVVAQEFDLLVYTVTITNKLKKRIRKDMIFREFIPFNTTLIKDSIKVHGAIDYEDISMRDEIVLNLGKDLLNDSIVIIFQVEINNNALGSVMSIASVKIGKIEINSNMVETQIVKPLFYKICDKSKITLGDEITYTIIIDNSLSLGDINNLIIHDLLQPEVIYEPKSIKIDEESLNYLNINEVMKIGNINKGEIRSLTFKCKVNGYPKEGIILNKLILEYELDGFKKHKEISYECIEVISTGFSVLNQLIKKNIRNKQDLTCNIVIINEEEAPIDNIMLKCNLSGIIYDDCGITVNGVMITNLNPCELIDIKDKLSYIFPLRQGEKILISYGVKIKDIIYSYTVQHMTMVNSQYFINSQIKDVVKVSDIAIYNKREMFENVSVRGVIKIDSKKPEIKDIISLKSNINIIQHKIINTHKLKEKNFNALYLTGKTMILGGTVSGKIIYSTSNDEESLYSTDFNILFDLIISLDENISIKQAFEIEGFIKDQNIVVISNRECEIQTYMCIKIFENIHVV